MKNVSPAGGWVGSPSDSNRWALLFLLWISPIFALGGRLPWILLPWHLGRILWISLTFGFVALLFLDVPRARLALALQSVLRGRTWMALLVAGSAVYFLLNAFYFRRYGYQVPWLGLGLCVIAPFALARKPLEAAWILSVGFLIASILAFPIVTDRSDMLPAIRLALDRWHVGEDPYGILPVTVGTNRMPYLPGLLFSHLPAWLAGLDLRWNSVVYRLVWGGVLAFSLRQSPPNSPLRACAILLFLNPYLTFRHELYFEFDLLLIVLFWTFRRSQWAILALCLWTRQWNWVIAPFLWIGLSGNSFRSKLVSLASITGWAVAWGLLFWIVLGRTTSLDTMSIVLSKFQALVGRPNYIGEYGLTLYPLVLNLNLARYSQIIQGVCVLGLFLYALRASHEQAVWLGVISLALFILFNPLYWNYFVFELGVWWLGFEIHQAAWVESAVATPREPTMLTT